MRALEPQLLENALDLQDALLGGGFGHDPEQSLPSLSGDTIAFSRGIADYCNTSPSQYSMWGLHSPLLFWNCSHSALRSDRDILGTINNQVHRKSPYNFTLVPASVFAGKSFVRHQLRAADALVITLFDRVGFGIGEKWEARTARFAENNADRFAFYPKTGLATGSRLYEFRFNKISLQDDFLLGCAYLAMLIYSIHSLRRVKAVKSQWGLILTAITQMGVSIISSTTICALMKINLSHIPSEAYPFVVYVIGIENIFRLMNAVIATKAEGSTITRIGTAFGEVAHLSLAATGQNLLILFLLSRVTYSSVQAFCCWAMVALVFDFVFHLTFFLAVLSVDVRRMELQDSLQEKETLVEPRHGRSNTEPRTWHSAFVQGKLPFSTRIAGSAITICFVFALNYHFVDGINQILSYLRFPAFLRPSSVRVSRLDPISPPPPINQARTPLEWLKVQNYESGEEVINFVKPNAHSFIARVYEPLIIVTHGADRGVATGKSDHLLATIANQLAEHTLPFLLVLVFALGVVTLLMNYLLWKELPDEEFEEHGADDSALTVQSLPKSHNLDVVKLTACGKGHMLSIGLDRSIFVWFYNSRTSFYTPIPINTTAIDPPLWPIVAAAIDETGTYFALCTDYGVVQVANLQQRRFVQRASIDLQGRRPMAFSVSVWCPEGTHKVLAITADGWIFAVDIVSGALQTHRISQNPLLTAHITSCGRDGHEEPKVLCVSRNGIVQLSYISASKWATQTFESFGPRLLQDGKLSKVSSVLPIPTLCCFLVVRYREIDLVDGESRGVIHTFATDHVEGHSARLLHSQRKGCACGAAAVHSLSIAYTEAGTRNCIVQTFTAIQTPSALICLRPYDNHDHHSCPSFEEATESYHWVEHPGTWEATQMQALVGIRKPTSISTPTSATSSSSDTDPFHHANGHVDSGFLKHRIKSGIAAKPKRTSTASRRDSETEDWEAWTLSTTGELNVTPLSPSLDRKGSLEGGLPMMEDDQLFVAKPGPIVRLGKRSVAVGLGNTVKVIMLGTARFEEDSLDELSDPAVASVKWRKKHSNRKAL